MFDLLPPALILLGGALLIALLRGHARSAVVLGFPLITLWAVWQVPDGVAGGKPYALLIKGMQDAGVVAISQVVLSGREQLALIRPQDGMMIMTVLNYPKKVKALDTYREEVPSPEMSKEERCRRTTPATIS